MDAWGPAGVFAFARSRWAGAQLVSAEGAQVPAAAEVIVDVGEARCADNSGLRVLRHAALLDRRRLY